MLRRLITVAVVFAIAFALQGIHTQLLTGHQELQAELRPVTDGGTKLDVVLRDIAGNPVEPGDAERSEIERRLAGDDQRKAIAVASVTYETASKRLVIDPGQADPGELRSRIVGRPFQRANEPKGFWHLTQGIDLRGGVEFTCRLVNDEGRNVPADDETMATLRSRLDERGLTEPAVTRLANGQVQIIIPGGTRADAARTRKVLESTGRLEFREVLEVFPNEQFPGTKAGDATCAWIQKPNGTWAFNPGVYAEREWAIAPQDVEPGLPFTQFYKLGPPRLAGKDVRNAYETMQEGQRAVGIDFTAVGASKNGAFTRDVKSKGDAGNGTGRLAIVFDGVVRSAPTVQSPSDASCVITGRFSSEEIASLRSVLKSGSLSVTPVVLSERVVGATLGSETVTKAMVAMIGSFLLIVAFMFWYYRRLGLVANCCLVFTSILIWQTMTVFDATVTLPGLAGLVLTIGMAVDTNILIFERIREELKGKAGLKAAIEAGYDRAFLTLIDSHLTTFFTALILYFLGDGPVKGFGLTLMIGIGINLFSGVFIGRMITDWLCRGRDTVTMVNALSDARWPYLPYVKWRFYGYAFSIITAIAGLAFFAFGHVVDGKGQTFERNFDIDFTGGTMVQVTLNEKLDGHQVDQAITAALAADPKLDLLQGDLRKQPYYARLNETGASRQWVFRVRDAQGSEIEAARDVLERERNRLQREADQLTNEKKLAEAAALQPQIKDLNDRIRAKSREIGNRTDAFKDQLAKAFAGKLDRDGSEVAALAWSDATLKLTLKTLEAPSATQCAEIATRLTRGEVTAVQAVADGSTLVLTATWRSAPSGNTELDLDDAQTRRMLELTTATAANPDLAKAQAQVALDFASRATDTAAGQGVTVAKPFPSSQHFSGQVAAQMKISALIATVLSLLAILAYVAARFEFRFGLGAVIALVHDVGITVGLLALLGIPIDLTVIAALLTIVGYSINDTIVTFDRIRENLKKQVGTLTEVIDLSIGQTMPRTILTTGTVLITVVILFFAGGESLHAFSVTLLIGLTAGTYSSIFVAAPLLLTFGGKIVETPAPADPNALPVEVIAPNDKG